MDYEKFIDRFKDRLLTVLNDTYGLTDLTDITSPDVYYFKSDREIEVYGVLFDFFFRESEIKIVAFALRQLIEFDIECVFTENVTVKQIDDFIYNAMIELDDDEAKSIFGDRRIQNTPLAAHPEYVEILKPY